MASHDIDRDGVLRSYSDSPPSHYSLKVESFSLMIEHSVNGYEAEEFEAGGYEWKLVIYPNGNEKRNAIGYISLYLEMPGEISLQSDWEVYVDFRLFLLDQEKGKYLVLEDAFAKENCFHLEMFRSPGFDKLMPLEEFTDASNGYVVDDTCVFGAEVFVFKERTKRKIERLLMVDHAVMYKQVWKVEHFSKLKAGYYVSKTFNAGDQKWQIQLYPKGCGEGIGSHLSIFLSLADWKPTPPVSKIFAVFSLRIVDQKHADHETWTGKRCFTTKSSSWGLHKFISLSNFSEADKGFLVENTCILEAEVTVHGFAKLVTCNQILRKLNSVVQPIFMTSSLNFDDQDGVLRSITDAPPTHYTVKIESLSLLTKNSLEKYESGEFEAGGYKWKLVFYPNGNKSKNVTDHISLYLVMGGANTSKIFGGVHAVFRLFLLDQNTGNYWVFQEQKQRHFHGMKLAWGFDQFLSLKAFSETSYGFLMDDTCVFGAEVFVSKERSTGKGECLSMVKDAVMYKHVWKIDNFSKIVSKCHESKTFSSGDQTWKIQLYPKGKGSGMGSHLSLYLALADPESLPPGSKIYTDFTLRILDLSKYEIHQYGKVKFWFSAANPEQGFQKFVSLSDLSHPALGYLLKDTCNVEAEITVHGISTALE